MKKFKVWLRAGILLLLPSPIIRFVGPLFAIRLEKGARIGFSVLLVEKLELARGTRISHFNLLKLHTLLMSPDAAIGKFNLVLAPTLDIVLHQKAAIGDQNTIYRANFPVTYATAKLEIGILSKITYKHHLDCTRSISMGDYSVLAGAGSQIWTHGYFFAEEGIDRVRIDGEVRIGNNVNISSACVINSGVTIVDAVTVGSNVCVSKSLMEKGMYVSQGLRCIQKDIDGVRKEYVKVQGQGLLDEIYVRNED